MNKQDIRITSISALTALIVVLLFQIGSGVMALLHSDETPAPTAATSQPGRGFGGPGGDRRGAPPPELLKMREEERALLGRIADLLEGTARSGGVPIEEAQGARHAANRAALRAFRQEMGLSPRAGASEAAIETIYQTGQFESMQMKFKNGTLPMYTLLEAELAVNRANQTWLMQPEMVRKNVGFLDALDKWQKTPSEAALRAILDAEQQARTQN